MIDLVPPPDPDDDPGSEIPSDDELYGGPGSFFDRLKTAREFCEVVRPVPTPLMGPLLYRGSRLVVAAGTGDGKSTFCTQLTRGVVMGEEFLGWQGAGGVRGLILDVEQDDYTLEDVLRKFHLEACDDIDILHIPEGAELDKNELEQGWMEYLLEQGNYGIVLADPLYKLFRGDSTSEREAVELMRRFDRWRMGVPGRWDPFGLVMPMHARKPPPRAKFTMAEIFGSTAWVRGAETVVGIQMVNHGYTQMYPWKRRGRIGDVDGITFQRGDTIGLLYDDEQGFRRGKAQAREKAVDMVLRLIREENLDRGWSTAMLQEAVPGRNGKTPASRSTIDRALKDLGEQVIKTTGADGESMFRPNPRITLPMEPPDDDELRRLEEMAHG